MRSAELEALHSTVAVDLLHYFLRRVDTPEDAADLVADAFLIAWRRVGRLPTDPEQQRMWMFGIARNCLANWHRGRRRRIALSDALREVLSRTHTPVERDDVTDALDSLPVEQAELVRLVHWDGVSVVDAAKVLGIRESTARGRYQRARLALRIALEATPARTRR
ncbi:sigma-70 family RNA polymerase sigma factor [Glaciihabitans arcticus]|uniref:Sigma-70 family RNA polymerase sigma factor n=1 Tax=Glaciihabitans arcticus TaxID=2668039 RepID=A0A4Q9GW33_9MICO|nr:sigma-70 family RNA polymerase sigma factor [Glaciihabitans arcticus]TBN56883.1 sigma-70 family RNA polymerase sigma factor [Glaciihabitans arcticus]